MTQNYARFDAQAARTKVIKAEKFQQERLVRYALRPFDIRWCYYTGVRPVWNEPRPTLWKHMLPGNVFLSTRPAGVASPEGFPVTFTRLLGDNDALRGHAYYFPLQIRKEEKASKENLDQTAFGFKGKAQHKNGPIVIPNASEGLANYLKSLKRDLAEEEVRRVWHHILAITYAPVYLKENADGIRQNWPRIPLPSSEGLLGSSSGLGCKVAALLDTESLVEHVTAGQLLPELKLIGRLHKIDGKPLDEGEDLRITAGWGHAGKDGIVMPGQGKLIKRERSKAEMDGILGGVCHLSEADIIKLLGTVTCDVYLNDGCAWKNIPEKVWEFFIGGYQVIKKRLSYREFGFLGRPITTVEADEVTETARRLTQLCLMQPKLDANYLRIKAAAYSWPKSGSEEEPVAVGVDEEQSGE